MMNDYAHGESLVNILAIQCIFTYWSFEAYKSNWLVARKSLTSLVSFIARFRAHDAVGLARYKVEAALDNAILGHSVESHAR